MHRLRISPFHIQHGWHNPQERLKARGGSAREEHSQELARCFIFFLGSSYSAPLYTVRPQQLWATQQLLLLLFVLLSQVVRYASERRLVGIVFVFERLC